MSLAQIGEFAFVLLSRASNLHLVEVNASFCVTGSTILALLHGASLCSFLKKTLMFYWLHYCCFGLFRNLFILSGKSVPAPSWNNST